MQMYPPIFNKNVTEETFSTYFHIINGCSDSNAYIYELKKSNSALHIILIRVLEDD